MIAQEHFLVVLGAHTAVRIRIRIRVRVRVG
jgi:hypothetical protein